MADRFVTRIAVFLILRNNQGDLLLQQRSNTGFLDGYYDFAASGHVEDGETIRDCAIRELEEEIGIKASVNDLELVHFNQNILNTPYINFTFRLNKWFGEPRILEPEKCSDLAYFAPHRLPAKCTLNVRVNQAAGFSDTLNYSFVTSENYAEYMGEPLVNKGSISGS